METELILTNFEMLGQMLKDKVLNEMTLIEIDELSLTEFMYDLGATMSAIQLAKIGKISKNFAATAVDVFNDKWTATCKELLGQ